MNLHSLFARRRNNPVRVLLIGAGKFGAMFLAQAPCTPGLHVAAIADLACAKVRQTLARIGWSEERYEGRSLAEALSHGTTFVTDDALSAVAHDEIDVVIEATGAVEAGIAHALASRENAKHVVMVTVEADALAGPLLKRKAEEAGVIYSLAYGDQPALICELVDWARCSGFTVVAAGKGTKYLPKYHDSTPDTVWEHYGFNREAVAKGDFNPRMFNSFLDGTKSAIEMAAVANATGLAPAPDGLDFPSLRRRRFAEDSKATLNRGHFASRGSSRSRVELRARWERRRPRSALGRVRGFSRRFRLREALLS